MSGILTTYAAQVRAAVAASSADRAAFLLQGAAMVTNNLFVLAMWFLFFAGFRSIGGWRMADMALLTALLALVVGTAGVVAGGYRDLARQIVTGVPDALLTQPKPVLPRLLAAESNVIGWGDIVTGLALLVTVAHVRAADPGWIVMAFAAGLIVFVSTAVAFASLAFWISGARSFARDLTDFVVTVSFYPGSIYGGVLKAITYTVLPAAFVTLIPVAVIREHSLAKAAALALASLAYATIAVVLFELGLRRYRRGDAPVVEE